VTEFEIFLVVPPGHEGLAADEARAAGFADAAPVAGGVTLRGGWPQVWRANLDLRIPTRVLVRLGAFRALHLAQLDKRARRFPWGDTLRPDVPIRVEASTRASKIWHAGAAQQRVETALREDFGATLATDAPLLLKVRIEDDLVTLSLDTSGEALHKRGWKQAVAKAPLRETLAAAFLRQAGFDGTQVVIDPMCGSGTLVIEAAQIAAGLPPGAQRDFAFQRLASFDPAAWAALLDRPAPPSPPAQFFGQDRDDGAIRMSRANAQRAGVEGLCHFARQPISDMAPPANLTPGIAPGLVITNPPWGARIGERKLLFALYATLGRVLAERFAGWRVALIAPDAGLIKATGLGLDPAGPPVDIGGIKASLWLGDLG
jgi:putative N6-adenine-specific DNA methylase